MDQKEREWWQEPLRVLQNNLQVQDTGKMNPPKIAEETLALHANTLVINFAGIYAWYPTDIPFHTRNPYLPTDYDLMEEIITACHAQNIRVVARFDFSKADDGIYLQHPEWFVRLPDGSTRCYGKERFGTWSKLLTTCLNGGYRREEVAAPVLREVLSRYEIDGIFFNAPHFEFCTCNRCREKFRGFYGEEMPAFPEYTEKSTGTPKNLPKDWAARVFQENMEFLYATVKQSAPKVPVILYYNGYRSDHLTKRIQAADLICTEAQDILSYGRKEIPEIWHPAISMRMGRTPEHYPIPFGIIHSCPGMDWRHTGLPSAEYEFWMSGVPANGGNIWHSVTGFGDTISDKRIYQSIQKVNQKIERIAAVMDGAESCAEVLLLWDNPAGGITEALLANHIPFDIACPEQLTAERLSRYPLVIAPAEMDIRPFASLLKAYLSHGGKLLSEFQCPTEETEALFGVAKNGEKGGYLTACYLRMESKILAKELEETPLLPHRGEIYYCKPLPESNVLATLVPPFATLDCVGSPPERASLQIEKTEIPLAVTVGENSLYLPFQLGHLLETFALPEHRIFFRNCVDFLLPDPMLLVSAPTSVQVTIFKKENQYILHLINGTGRRPLQEKIPLYHLTFHLKTAAPVLSVKSLIEETPLTYTPTKDGITVQIDSLQVWDAYEIICGEGTM